MDQKSALQSFSSCISERRPDSDIICNCAQKCPICFQVNSSISAMGAGSSKPTSSIPDGSGGPPIPAGRQVLEDYQTNFLEEQNKKRMAIHSLKPYGQENSASSPSAHENNPAENRLRSGSAMDEHLQHIKWAHDAPRTALLPRRQIHPERSAGLQELRRVARLVLQIFSYRDLPAEEHRSIKRRSE